jgi:thiol:disulfide interchange protein DsbD
MIGVLASFLLVLASADAHTAPLAAAEEASRAGGAWSELRRLLRSSEEADELLPADRAFRASIRARDATTLIARLEPAPGYYLYRDRIRFRVHQPAGIEVASVELPPGETKDDPGFGRVEVFPRAVEVVIKLKRRSDPAIALALRASYQGCNEPHGVCYPPIEKVFDVALPARAARP